MPFKPEKTGINFLCDTIILPQYYNFERESAFKTDFENFKKIRFECWNLFIAAYYLCALQSVLGSMKEDAYIQLMKKTMKYFRKQYPLFDRVLKVFLDSFDPDNPSCTEMGKLLSWNLLQAPEEQLSMKDINMGCDIAETIYNLVSVIDPEEMTDF